MIDKFLQEWFESADASLYENDTKQFAVLIDSPYYVYKIIHKITNELLYVGITYDVKTRMGQHYRKNSTSQWISEPVSINIFGCGSREEAAAIEALSIWKERPKYNKTGKEVVGRKVSNISYYKKNKDLHRSKYKEQKLIWETHPNGKQAGVSMYQWWNKVKTAKNFS